MATTPDAQHPAKRPTPTLVGAGVLVILFGFGLPRLITDPPADPKPAAAEPVAAPRSAAPAAPVVAPADGPAIGVALARLAGSLVLVCGLCVGATKLLGRRPSAPTPGMEVIAALPVDPRCAVYLVKAGDRRLLVGLDAGGVKALVELPGPPPEPVADLPTRPVGSTVDVVVGPVSVPAPVAAVPGPAVAGPVAAPAGRPSLDEIQALIARLRNAA